MPDEGERVDVDRDDSGFHRTGDLGSEAEEISIPVILSRAKDPREMTDVPDRLVLRTAQDDRKEKA